jgi:hypothetical protein
MYHIELRQFPHNFAHFNLRDGDLKELVEDWVQGRIVELGERKWNPATARLKILEGPELPLGELSMGRGWPTAKRRSVEVTERVLADARARLQPITGPPAVGAPAGTGSPVPTAVPLTDPLAVGVQMAALLGPDATRLLEAWRAVAATSKGLTPSETLALAERTLAAEQSGA